MVHASPASAKTVMRLQMRNRRRQLARETPDAGEQTLSHLPPGLIRDGIVVSGYRRRGSEIDPWPLMGAFAKAGASLALPVTFDRESALKFRAYADGDPLEPDAFNILAPTAAAAIVEPKLVITPLLAFDRLGGRMGMGAGFYDRTLEVLRARGPVFVLGVAYAGQEVARVPLEPHDQRLDAILTEKAYIGVSKD